MKKNGRYIDQNFRTMAAQLTRTRILYELKTKLGLTQEQAEHMFALDPLPGMTVREAVLFIEQIAKRNPRTR